VARPSLQCCERNGCWPPHAHTTCTCTYMYTLRPSFQLPTSCHCRRCLAPAGRYAASRGGKTISSAAAGRRSSNWICGIRADRPPVVLADGSSANEHGTDIKRVRSPRGPARGTSAARTCGCSERNGCCHVVVVVVCCLLYEVTYHIRQVCEIEQLVAYQPNLSTAFFRRVRRVDALRLPQAPWVTPLSTGFQKP